MSDYLDLFQRVAVAFSIGMLIGLERGWKEREAGEGQRVAGLRTFGLIALVGALVTLLTERFGGIVLAGAILAMAAMMLVAYAQGSDVQRERGITTEVAALLTFLLGATAAAGYEALSAAVAVVAALTLGLKPQLHAWVAGLQQQELLGALKLLVISVVLLPVLPNQNYGPWGMLNPYQLWWLVVLIATIGFIGYFAMKLAGPRFGTMLTGGFGGLVSSTAVALNFSRLARSNDKLHALLAAGIVLASTTMLPRVLIMVSVINGGLATYLLPVMGGMTVAALATAWWLWHTEKGEPGEQPALRLPNPFELMPALQIGALLVVMMVASRACAEWFGASGVYALALFSGFADVDAIALSMAKLAGNGLDTATAARAVVIAAFANTIGKGALVWFIGGRSLGRRVGYAFGITLLVGLLLLILLPLLR